MDFKTITSNMHKAVVDFHAGSDRNDATQRIKADFVPVEEATGVSSAVNLDPTGNPAHCKHKPVLDLDIAHYYGESTTPGHAHLILNVELDWKDYVELLRVLEKCKILEPGYVAVAISRGESWMRTPWVKKQPGDTQGSNFLRSNFNPKTGWVETVVQSR